MFLFNFGSCVAVYTDRCFGIAGDYFKRIEARSIMEIVIGLTKSNIVSLMCVDCEL